MINIGDVYYVKKGVLSNLDGLPVVIYAYSDPYYKGRYQNINLTHDYWNLTEHDIEYFLEKR